MRDRGNTSTKGALKIRVRNLGVLKQAEFSVGDFTIICGKNNTGKTHVTYALYGFLESWRSMLPNTIVDKKAVETLLKDGVVRIDIQHYTARAPRILSQSCIKYSKQLPRFLAANSKLFQETIFDISVPDYDISSVAPTIKNTISTENSEIISFTKTKNSTELVVSRLVDQAKVKIPVAVIADVVSDVICTILYSRLFPNPFIVSAERTGAAIFRRELDFARNRLLDEMKKDQKIDPLELLFTIYKDYALPVKKDVEFARNLGSTVKENSFVAEKHPNILDDFADILGGDYLVARDELYFKPKGSAAKLSMNESSSSVRSLLDIGLYLRHVAQKGDVLMVDEPELNLHPCNQRRIVRLFARLVNVGIKVFITTHSDYIIKELNTLIMLNNDCSHLQEIAEHEGYKNEELISPDKIKAYLAKKDRIQLPHLKNRTRHLTLVPAPISTEQGVEVEGFDEAINDMNRIQEKIIWGGDE